MEFTGERIWRLSLFGGLTLTSPECEAHHIHRPKVAELLAYLALRRTPIVDRDTIVEALWPDAEFGSGRNRLKQTLALLRQEVPALPILVHGKNGLELPRYLVEIESETLEARMKWLRVLQVHERSDAARQMWEVVRLGLLPELASPWIFAEQTRFESIEEKLRLEFEGSPPSARPAFRFGDEFGGAKIPIVGREEELARIKSWLTDAPGRYLTLVGPPGVGKTRLLQEAISPANSICDATVSLSTVQASEAPWLERIGQVIGIRGHEHVTEGLIRLLLGFKRPLIAIDDLDQADEGMRDWLEQIRLAVPDVKILGTARRHAGESTTEYLEVLPLPTAREGTSEATDLLVKFAAHFGVTAQSLDEHRETLEELVTHLEGLPLALEVAAGWLPFMQADRLLRQLRASPALVINRAAEGRDSLTQCMEAICSSLPEPDREALRCLSLCRGGCGEDLAEEIMGSEWPWRIRSLSDRSLIFKALGNRGNRFVVLQALRESVQAVETTEKMAEASDLRRLACLRLAERAAWEINEGDRAGWLDLLRDEGDNILNACEQKFDDLEMVDRAIRLLDHFRAPFWLIGRTSEFRRIFTEGCAILDRSRPHYDSRMPLSVLRLRMEKLCKEDKAKEAVEIATRLRQQSLAEKDSPYTTAALYDVEGEMRWLAGDLEEAKECFLRAGPLYLEGGYRRHALWLESKIAGMERRLSQLPSSLQRRRNALKRAGELEDFNSVGMYSKEFAKDAIKVGEWPLAQKLAREAIHAFNRAGESITTFDAHLVLAAAYLGDKDRASASMTLTEASEFAPLADEKRLRDFAKLKGAAFEGIRIDLLSVDIFY